MLIDIPYIPVQEAPVAIMQVVHVEMRGQKARPDPLIPFAALLDIALNIEGCYAIPNYDSHIERPIPTCVLGPNVQVGHALFLLSDLGLIGDVLTTQRKFPANCLLRASYGTHSLTAITKQEWILKGAMLTSLGNTIAKLYEPKENALGLEIYNAWLSGVRESTLNVLHEI